MNLNLILISMRIIKIMSEFKCPICSEFEAISDSDICLYCKLRVCEICYIDCIGDESGCYFSQFTVCIDCLNNVDISKLCNDCRERDDNDNY